MGRVRGDKVPQVLHAKLYSALALRTSNWKKPGSPVSGLGLMNTDSHPLGPKIRIDLHGGFLPNAPALFSQAATAADGAGFCWPRL